jgi:hypothetical protein
MNAKDYAERMIKKFEDELSFSISNKKIARMAAIEVSLIAIEIILTTTTESMILYYCGVRQELNTFLNEAQ